MKKKLFLGGLLAAVLSVASACGGGIKDENSDLHGGSSFVAESQEDGSNEGGILDGDSGDKTEEGGASVEDGVSDGDSDDKTEDGENTETYHTVTFDTDGGSTVESVSVRHGEKIAEPSVPEKSSMSCEYEFLGWFFDGEAWDFDNDTVTEAITLVAHWKIVDKYTEPFLPKD